MSYELELMVFDYLKYLIELNYYLDQEKNQSDLNRGKTKISD